MRYGASLRCSADYHGMSVSFDVAFTVFARFNPPVSPMEGTSFYRAKTICRFCISADGFDGGTCHL